MGRGNCHPAYCRELHGGIRVLSPCKPHAHSDRFNRKFRAEETKLVHYPLVNPTRRSAGSRRPDAARHATDFLQEETATSGGNQKNACLESRMHHSGSWTPV